MATWSVIKLAINARGPPLRRLNTYALSNLHSLPDFWHWSHFGKLG